MTWEIQSFVREVQRKQADPGNGPVNRPFVPDVVRSEVLLWSHTSHFACHPGVGRTLSLLKQYFWWPTMEANTHAYVLACAVCARGKSSNRPPAGLLYPLPVPSRPWSHVALDFVTGLPPSNGITVILTIVDRFSKSALRWLLFIVSRQRTRPPGAPILCGLNMPTTACPAPQLGCRHLRGLGVINHHCSVRRRLTWPSLQYRHICNAAGKCGRKLAPPYFALWTEIGAMLIASAHGPRVPAWSAGVVIL